MPTIKLGGRDFHPFRIKEGNKESSYGNREKKVRKKKKRYDNFRALVRPFWSLIWKRNNGVSQLKVAKFVKCVLNHSIYTFLT